jgi:septal ring factor EnvC (AmiA/AmiB activator)
MNSKHEYKDLLRALSPITQENEVLEDSLASPQLPSAKQKQTSFLSLINTALKYFQQSSPIDPEIYTSAQRHLEAKLKKAQLKHLALQTALKSQMKNCESLKHQLFSYEKSIEHSELQLSSLKSLVRSKEQDLEQAKFELKQIKSLSSLSKPRRHTLELIPSSLSLKSSLVRGEFLSEHLDTDPSPYFAACLDH